jgi:hypothetical protein
MKINYILFAIFLTLTPSKTYAQELFDIDSNSLKQLSLFTCQAFDYNFSYSRVREAITGGILIARENQSFAVQNRDTYNSTSSYIFEIAKNFEYISAEATSFSLINYAVKNYCPQYNNYRTDL